MRTKALITAALFVLLLSACGRDAQEVARSSEEPASPTEAVEVATTEPAASTSTQTPAPAPATPAPSPTFAPDASEDEPGPRAPASQGPEVELWFLRDRPGFTLEPEVHRLGDPTQAVARATLELLVTATPRDPALDNVIPAGTEILGVSLKNETLTVDLKFADEYQGMGSGYEATLFDQIIHTAAQFETVRRVLILEEGRTPQTDHGVILDKPREPDEDAISPVIITNPAHGQRVSAGNVTVSGTANVYEATVVLRLVDPTGKTVERSFATATCGTGCRGTWEYTFDKVTTPGRWKVVAGASDPSGGEGPPPYTVKRRFVVE